MKQATVIIQTLMVKENEQNGYYRKNNKKESLVGKKAEGSSGIASAGDDHKIVPQMKRAAESQTGHNPGFGSLVKKEDQAGQKK